MICERGRELREVDLLMRIPYMQGHRDLDGAE